MTLLSPARESDAAQNGRRSLPRRLRPWGWFALALLVLLPMLGRRDIVTSHEARVVQVARQMAASGWPWSARPLAVPAVQLTNSNGVLRLAPVTGQSIDVNPWLVPVLNGGIRLQKPPLPYWCTAALFRLFGEDEGVARIVPALMGAVGTVLMLGLGRRLWGRVAGWVAAGVWLSGYFVFDEFRKTMADPYLAFFTLLCVWAWVTACEARRGGFEHPGPAGEPKDRSPGRTAGFLLLVSYLSLGLAALAKGPLIFLHVTIALACYHVCCRRRFPGGLSIHAAGIALCALVSLPWYLHVLRHVPHALDLWRYESVGELSENVENQRPWWFYLPQLPQIALPWTALLVLGAAQPFLTRRGIHPLAGHKESDARGFAVVAAQEEASTVPPASSARKIDGARRPVRAGGRVDSTRRLLFPLLWYAITVLFFSVVKLKKNAYLLPAMPAQTLLVTAGICTLVRLVRVRRQWASEARTIALIQSIVGVGFAIALGVMMFKSGAGAASSAAAAGLALLVAAYPMVQSIRRRPARWALGQCIAYAVAIALFFGLYVAPTDNLRSPKPLCRELSAMLAAQPERTILVSRLPEEASVYLPVGLQYNPSAHHVLVVIDDRHGVKDRKRSRTDDQMIPSASYFSRWISDGRVTAVERVSIQSAPGDARWKVFDLTVDRTQMAGASTLSE